MKKIICIIITSIMLFNGTSFANAKQENTISISPFEDTYIEKNADDADDKKNYLCDNIFVKGKSLQMGYFFFHLDDKPCVNDRFILKITPEKIITEKDDYIPRLLVCSIDNHDVKTSELTEENAPTQTGSITEFEAEERTEFSVDITDYVISNLSSKKNIGICLKDTDPFDTLYTFYSAENKNGASVKMQIKKNGGVAIPDKKNVTADNSATQAYGTEKRHPTLNSYKIEYTDLPENINIDDYTTTRYKPWLVNYHLTEPYQIENDYYGGDAGQSCYAADVSPTDPNVVLIGSDTESIFRSDNGGVTWVSSANGIGSGGTEGLSFYPDDGNVVFALCGRRTSYKSYGQGIYKSADSGKTWTCVYEMITGHQQATRQGPHFAFGEKNQNGQRRIYVQSFYSGVFYSDDMGATWVYLNFNGDETSYIHSYDNKVIVGSRKIGLWISEDEGQTWEQRGSDVLGNTVYDVAMDPRDNTHWFSTNGDTLYESDDEGMTWTYLNDIMNIKGETFADETQSFTAVGIGFIRFMAPDENGNHIMAIMTMGGRYVPRYSMDYGKTFQAPALHREMAYIESNWGSGAHPLITHPTEPNIAWCSLDGEIYKTVDGFKSLWPSSSGYSGHRAAGGFWFNPDKEDDWLFMFTDRGFARTVPSGNGEQYPAMTNEPSEDKYSMRFGGVRDMNAIARDPNNKDRFLMASKKGTLIESLDDGWTWQTVTTPNSATSILFSPDDANTVYAGKNISHDGGKTWIGTERDIAAISPVNHNIMYSVEAANFYKSDNGGKTWTHLFHAGAAIQSVVPDSVEADKVYFGTFNKGLKVYDGKELKNFEGLHLGAGNVPGFYDVAQDPQNPKHLVTCNIDNVNVAPSGGISESFDGGKTWRWVEGMPITADAWKIDFHPTLHKVFFATSLGTFVYEYDKYYDMNERIFLDTENSPYKNEIDTLYNMGIIGQFSDGNFYPKSQYTRAEVASIIRHAFNYTYNSTNQVFTDVSIFNRDFVNIGALYQKGIITGSNDGTFDTKSPITYDEATVIFTRILKLNGISTEVDLNSLMLDGKAAGYAKYSVAFCMKLGIINDVEMYQGNKIAVREDVTDMLYRVMKLTGHLEE